jgi:uncharacterized protein (DUF3084 family)
MTDQELDARFESFGAQLKAEIKSEGLITRRHFDVIAEGLRAEIKVVADGHPALRDDVTSLKTGQERLERGQERLEIRQMALEHRQGKLEERQGKLEERQSRLEGRQEGLEESQRDLVTEVRLLAARLPA